MKHHSIERTLVIIKPDGIQRTLIGEIIARYERVGLKLLSIKMMVPTEAQIKTHYTLDPEWKRKVGEKSIKSYVDKGEVPPSQDPVAVGERVLSALSGYMTSGPIILMVWQGAHAVQVSRKITGGTEPRLSDVGTIRGDFVLDSYSMADSDSRSVRNLVHASGTIEEAEAEITHWFADTEITNYRLVQEQILYSPTIQGIFE